MHYLLYFEYLKQATQHWPWYHILTFTAMGIIIWVLIKVLYAWADFTLDLFLRSNFLKK